MVEPPFCRQYKPGDSLAVRPLNLEEIIDEENEDENCADVGAPSGGSSRPSDGNDNDNVKGEENTQGGEKGTGTEKGTYDGKGNGKRIGKGNGKSMEEGKGKGNGEGTGIGKHTTTGDDIPRAVTLLLQKEMYKAYSDMEG
jgi:hypothetical protein